MQTTQEEVASLVPESSLIFSYFDNLIGGNISKVGTIIKVLLFFALNLIHALKLAIFFVRELFFTLPEILWCVCVILTHFLVAV